MQAYMFICIYKKNSENYSCSNQNKHKLMLLKHSCNKFEKEKKEQTQIGRN